MVFTGVAGGMSLHGKWLLYYAIDMTNRLSCDFFTAIPKMYLFCNWKRIYSLMGELLIA